MAFYFCCTCVSKVSWYLGLFLFGIGQSASKVEPVEREGQLSFEKFKVVGTIGSVGFKVAITKNGRQYVPDSHFDRQSSWFPRA